MVVTAGERAPGRSPMWRRRRRRLGLGLLLGGLLVIAVASVLLGSRPISPDVAWDAIVRRQPIAEHLIINSLRVPRTVLGALAGVAIGAAGALMQGHTRNPLADPGLLGVNQGAAFAVVLSVVVLGVQSLYGFIWFGFAGALVASVVVFALGRVGGAGSTPVTLALAGAAVSALLNGLTAAVVLGDRQGMETYRFWHVGSVAGRDYAVTGQVLPFLLLGLIVALVNARGLNTLSLGDDVATALGRHVRRTRALGILAVTLLTGSAVAACGPIAFLGLIVPHLARAITGPDYRWLVPCSALLGAAVLLTADVLGRVLAGDILEVGILLAVLGAPVFIVLVRRKGLMRL